MPSISVIIPAYNAQDTIVETIESVLNQTFGDLEVLVIDDGSQDLTGDRVRSFDDPRVKFLPYKNGGVALARNRGIANAKGEYISFLDHDDLWTPDKLKDQLAALQKNDDAGVAYSWTTCMFSDENPVRYKQLDKVYFEGNVYDKILLINFIGSGSNILARKEAIESVGGFDAAPVSNEDLDFYIRLAAKWHFALVPKHQILYRQLNSSMSSNIRRLEQGGLVIAQKAYRDAPKELQHLKKRFLYNQYIYYTNLNIENYINSIKPISRISLKDAYRSLFKAIAFMPSALVQMNTIEPFLKLLLISAIGSTSVKQLKKVKRRNNSSSLKKIQS